MRPTYRHLEADAAGLRASFELIRVLRPHLPSAEAFVAQVARQAQHGYRLLAVLEGDTAVGLAGYRETENLIYGRMLYVDDLVVSAALQGSGVGARLLGAVREQARLRGCTHLVLDTGLHMALAQRFYFRQGLLARGMHFVEPLGDEVRS